MDTHRIVVAWLHIVTSLFVIICVALLWWATAGLTPLVAGSFIPELIAWVGKPVAFAFLLFAGIELAASIALLKQREWGRALLTAVSAIQIWIVPIGTAIALYTLCGLWKKPHQAAPVTVAGRSK